MIKVICKLAAVSVLISGCNYRTNNSNDKLPHIVCVRAPVGGVTPDDIYVSKMGQAVILRCPPNMVPKIVIGVGGDTPATPEKPVAPENPKPDAPTSPDKVEFSHTDPAGATPSGATAAEVTSSSAEVSRAGYGQGAIAIQDGQTLKADIEAEMVSKMLKDAGL